MDTLLRECRCRDFRRAGDFSKIARIAGQPKITPLRNDTTSRGNARVGAEPALKIACYTSTRDGCRIIAHGQGEFAGDLGSRRKCE